MTDRKLMQQARNALMYLWDGCPTDKDLIERLDDQLAQPEREWQGLTDDQIQQIEMSASSKLSAIYLAEAQLKGKNAL
jgi:hypothetical protein